MVKLFNTLSGKIEEFKPISGAEVRMYSCGPTVYNYAHIGNLRAYVFTDTFRRVLEWNGYKVKQVMNLTDVGQLTSDADEGEDKMAKALKREGKAMTMEAMHDVGSFYAEAFVKDLEALNIELPDIMPRASENVEADIDLIKILEKKGIAYKISDGVYFDISKYADYGKLGGVGKSQLAEGARVAVNADKRDPRDFNLWKFTDNPKLGWQSPWGHGFPGWHIECSAMSRKYLGQPFDIHTGGVDHIGTHHNNEIAQSEAAYDTPLANYWLHNAHLNFGESKMAKSGEGFITMQTLRERGTDPLSYRYYLLGAGYRTPMSFSFDALMSAQNSYERLQNVLGSLAKGGKPNDDYLAKFTDALNDDLNTPRALSVLWEMLRDEKISGQDRLASALAMDAALGLRLEEAIKNNTSDIPADILALAADREKARQSQDWTKADQIRAEIKNLGYEVSDTETGQKITKAKD